MGSKYVDTTSIMQVIGCVYNNPILLDATDKYIITDEDFPDNFHKTVFGCIYKLYELGDEITYNGVNYYVMKSTDETEANVTLLKAEPLNVQEVNTYGGVGRHGGGAFSGKDPSKVDRSAAYAARYVAKNIVAAGLASKCEIELAYAIGVAEPVSIFVDTFGTGKISDAQLEDIVNANFDLRPAAIIEKLQLRKPQYRQLAAYGHMGREDLNVKWEVTDRVDDLRKYLNI